VHSAETARDRRRRRHRVNSGGKPDTQSHFQPESGSCASRRPGNDQVHAVVKVLSLAASDLEAMGVVALADLEAHAGLNRDDAHDPIGD
jgi:hypothetical protein